jgi:hypothetical protein
MPKKKPTNSNNYTELINLGQLTASLTHAKHRHIRRGLEQQGKEKEDATKNSRANTRCFSHNFAVLRSGREQTVCLRLPTIHTVLIRMTLSPMGIRFSKKKEFGLLGFGVVCRWVASCLICRFEGHKDQSRLKIFQCSTYRST